MIIEFQAWPKIARLNRTITITEKIDGTNAAVGIKAMPVTASMLDDLEVIGDQAYWVGANLVPGNEDLAGHAGYLVYAQSRKRIITPEADNHGFAKWVFDNAVQLATTLGPGLHFGEWWGSGIQRGYGLAKGEKRFSLFNTSRWNDQTLGDATKPNVPGLGVVPTLYEGPFDAGVGPGVFTWSIRPWERALDRLEVEGSVASPGFMDPEGIVIYHHAANMMFKVTIKDDEEPKALIAKRRRSSIGEAAA